VARRGENLDGHSFIGEAVRRGAQVILAERVVEIGVPTSVLDARPGGAHGAVVGSGQTLFVLVDDSQQALERVAAWWRSRLAVDVLAVTGSVGKTTTKEMIAAVLGQRFHTLKSERSLNTDVGMALTLLQLGPEHEKAVLEMGMYRQGEIAALCRLARPRIGVVTNVGPTHLERLGSLEAIAAAKAELVDALPASGVAILNGDDERVRAMAGRTAARVVMYGTSTRCDVRGSGLASHGLDGITFRLGHEGREAAVRSPLLGRHSVYTALGAAACAIVAGMSLEEAASGLGRAPAPVRLALGRASCGALLINDTYNAAPLSVMAALDLLAELPGRRVAVLGAMRELGAYEATGHQQVGEHAAQRVDLLVTVGETARLIGQAALAAGLAKDKVLAVADNTSAVQTLRESLQASDAVLIKGSRSLHMEDIVAAISA
jgi:UDP-N-acetylmuramoyl-tripeptide--D-alanyl-D-alanine ligase